PEWMMHTIVWRNRNDLDTMSLDDLYNHLKVYEAEVQTKSNSNSHNMAFISSSKNSSGNEDGNIAYVSTASTTFPAGSVNVAIISQDTASAYIASHLEELLLLQQKICREEERCKGNMAFISSSKNSSGNEDGNIAYVSTASTTFPAGSVNVAIISQDTASAYIASQSNGIQPD
nr:ribonuclease H-like domain-containing protein [Tanacetum cinerariifolium]